MNEIDQEVLTSLPPEMQIEILTDYKNLLKSKRSESFEEFPEDSEEFSLLQMKSMIHKGDIANKIKKLKNSMREDFSGN
jgi:hypothetical protein